MFLVWYLASDSGVREEEEEEEEAAAAAAEG